MATPETQRSPNLVQIPARRLPGRRFHSVRWPDRIPARSNPSTELTFRSVKKYGLNMLGSSCALPSGR